ncbi:hypothetical protein MTO96_050945 [Rhipicephalus appendiculatus]
MRGKAEDVLTALCLTTANAKKYAKVIGAFDSDFVIKKNIIYERALFNRRIQDEGEPMTDFLTALYTLAERCDYGDLKDELIRNRIVVGVRDRKLSTKLQLEQDLTLEKAQSHDERLALVLKRLLKAGVSLNKEKRSFYQNSVKFLGHIIDQNCVRPDECMIEAIVKMKPPSNVTEIKRFLGMTNFVSRFIPNFGDIAHPLTELLRKSNHFVWDVAQQQAFQEIKKALTSQPFVDELFNIYPPKNLRL